MTTVISTAGIRLGVLVSFLRQEEKLILAAARARGMQVIPMMDRELVLDWLWVSGAWDRVARAALEARAAAGVPQLWENFEALAQSQT